MEYFEGKTIMVDEQPVTIDARQARDIYRYLLNVTLPPSRITVL